MENGIELVAQRVAFAGDGVVGRGHAVHGQQTQAGLGVHLVDVVVDREADGIGAVIVGGDAVHQLTHGSGSQLGGRVHQFAALNEQLAEQGLAAGVFAPLEGHDGKILAAHFLPVGDLTGINILQLLPGQALDRIVLVHDEHQCVPANGFLFQLSVCFFQLFLYVVRRFVDHQHPGSVLLIRVQAEVFPRIGRGADRNAALGYFQIDAGGIGHHLGHQRDAGSAAIQLGKIFHGKQPDGFKLAHGRSGCFRRGGSAAGGGVIPLAGSENACGRAGGKAKQKAAAGNFSIFHKAFLQSLAQ